MNEYQKSLLEKSKQSIHAARILLDSQLYDSAVSRAYYAMFYLAQIFLLEKELTYSKHYAVISAFGQYFVKTGLVPEEFHKFLIKGQDKRITSDYSISDSISSSDALEIIEQAEKFYQYTEEYFNLKSDDQ